MSMDNWYISPAMKKYISLSQVIHEQLPTLHPYLVNHDGSFRGFTMFLGDSADVVVGLKTFGEDGSPLICWGSGDSPMEALLNIEKRVSSGALKMDKKAANPKPKASK